MDALFEKTQNLMSLMKNQSEGLSKYLVIDNFGETSVSGSPGLKDSLFRDFTPVKKEKGRKLNPVFDPSFNPYKDTLMDYPTIVQYKLGKMDTASWREYNRYLSLHVARCPINCWYCYLDECLRTECKFCLNSKNCTFDHNRQNCKEEWRSAEYLIHQFIEQREKDKENGIKSNILRLTGGEPFLVPDLHTELLDELKRNNLHKEVFLWTETNLIPLSLQKGKKPLIDDEQLKTLGNVNNYCVHPCFKGLNEQNFKENTGNQISNIDNLIIAFKRLLDHNIDIYPTFGSNVTSPFILGKFYQKISKINSLLPLRFNLIEFDLNYRPVKWRHDHIDGFSAEHEKVYDRFQVIGKWDELLYKNTGYHYADIPRHLVPIKVKT
jgi:organic radical activating enzyme